MDLLKDTSSSDEVNVEKSNSNNLSDKKRKKKSKEKKRKKRRNENQGEETINGNEHEQERENDEKDTLKVKRKKLKKKKLKDVDEDEDEDQSENEHFDDEEENSSLSYALDTYTPTDEEKQLLWKLEIQLRHEPPPQHMIEKTAGTRVLSKAVKELFETHVPLKIGAFSSEEDRILKKNWKAFCKLHNWDKKNPKPFLYMRPHNKFLLRCRKNRLRFVQFLADGLHDRSLYSVYHRFRILYEPHKTSRYAQEEDNVILNFIKNHDTNESSDRKFADLAIMLKRTRASVWRRYRVLKKKYKIATEQ